MLSWKAVAVLSNFVSNYCCLYFTCSDTLFKKKKSRKSPTLPYDCRITPLPLLSSLILLSAILVLFLILIRPGSYFSMPIRPHLVQKWPQVDDLYLKRLEETWAKNNRLSTSSRLFTWHSLVYLRLLHMTQRREVSRLIRVSVVIRQNFHLQVTSQICNLLWSHDALVQKHLSYGSLRRSPNHSLI